PEPCAPNGDDLTGHRSGHQRIEGLTRAADEVLNNAGPIAPRRYRENTRSSIGDLYRNRIAFYALECEAQTRRARRDRGGHHRIDLRWGYVDRKGLGRYATLRNGNGDLSQRHRKRKTKRGALRWTKSFPEYGEDAASRYSSVGQARGRKRR